MAAKPTMSRAMRDQLSQAMKRHVGAFRAYGAEGGKARATRLTKEQRRAIAAKAAKARWGTKQGKGSKG
jgi:hypothetical protein